MFNAITFCGVLIISILIQPNHSKLPSDVKPCKAGDKQCLVDTINKVIETKFRGDSDLDLISIDPLKINEMILKQPRSSPVSIEPIFRNSKVSGFKDFRAYKVRGFGANPEGKHEIYTKGPSATLLGDYSVDGKILILPIKGEGRSNITIDQVFIKIVIDAGSKVKNGATYLDVKSVKLNMNTTRMHFHLTNLFNGDKALGDNMNKFLNENWSDIYVEIKGAITKAFGEVFTDFIRKVFAAHPYKELVEGGK